MQTVIASKGRLVIPKEIRDALGVGDGDSVEINLDGASAVIRPLARGSKKIQDVFGLLSRYSQGSKITDDEIDAASLAANREP